MNFNPKFVAKSLLFSIYLRITVAGALPIDNVFSLPSPLPNWPSGGEFASGAIDLGGGGGLRVRQISSFEKIWTVYDGGFGNTGATFFEPSRIPYGYSLLGSYAQTNNQPLFGWILVGKSDLGILKQPVDYTLVWSNANGSVNFWLPVPPDGYKPVGHVITVSPGKPSLDKIRCVRSDFTDESELDSWIWGNVYSLRPKNRGSNAQSLSLGSFFVQNGSNSSIPLSCLKNKNSLSIPNLNQIEALFRTYSPYIYFHPKENYLPSSVNWFFTNGALLYKKGEESNPTPILANGTNLPQGGSNDGMYWIDLPSDDRLKKGDLQSVETYLHVKSILGGTFTDIQVWIFYPFNGHSTAKLGKIEEIPLGRIGEHVSDWEHVTLRISNFDGVLYKVYLAEHSGGTWVDASVLEYQEGNKFVVYSSLNGHASYSHGGLVLRGEDGIGIRDDCGKSDKVMDSGTRFSVVEMGVEVVGPPWLEYMREWGPKKSYETASELRKIRRFLIGKLRSEFDKLVAMLPKEVYGEEGPLGPKTKNNWNGDEI